MGAHEHRFLISDKLSLEKIAGLLHANILPLSIDDIHPNNHPLIGATEGVDFALYGGEDAVRVYYLRELDAHAYERLTSRIESHMGDLQKVQTIHEPENFDPFREDLKTLKNFSGSSYVWFDSPNALRTREYLDNLSIRMEKAMGITQRIKSISDKYSLIISAELRFNDNAMTLVYK